MIREEVKKSHKCKQMLTYRCGTKTKKALLTAQVDILLAGQPNTAVKLPQDKLVLSGLPHVLHLAAVVSAGAVIPDAVRVFVCERQRPGAKRLQHFSASRTPVARAERARGQQQRRQVEGERQRPPPPPLHNAHGEGEQSFCTVARKSSGRARRE